MQPPSWSRSGASIRQDFFSRFCDLERLSSRPLVPVKHSTEPSFHAALNSLKHLFFTDPPPGRGRAFTLRCLHLDGTIHDYQEPTYHALTEHMMTWSSGENKEWVINNVFLFFRRECCLMAEAIVATYFAGDENLDLDIESRDILVKYLRKDNVFSSLSKGSFWNTKDNGPCGPCVRFYYDPHFDKRDARTPIEQCIHLCTIVFVQSNREEKGDLERLPFEHVISVMNFEDLACLNQSELQIYSTDLVSPLLNLIHECAGPGINAYNFYVDDTGDDCEDDTDELGVAYRFYADHLRTILVANIDGTQIGDYGREYLLKFIDSQFFQLGDEKLKIHQEDYEKLVNKSIKAMVATFLETLPNKQKLNQIVKNEGRIYNTAFAEIEFQQTPRQPPSAKKTKGQGGTHRNDLEPNPPTTWYKTRMIKFFGHKTHIVHTDRKNKCCLASLCNVLLLGGNISLTANTTHISEGHLLHLIQNSLLCNNEKMELQSNLERSDFQIQVLNVLPHLSGIVSIDVKSESINGFVNSPETALFEYLLVSLYHGCILDTQDKTTASGGSQLTEEGLTRLQIGLKEKEPCVLFWNGSFITATKVDGAIHLLLDDLRFVDKHTEMFWELLKDVHQGGLFKDCCFTPADIDPSYTTLPLTRNEKKRNKKKAKQVIKATTADKGEAGEGLDIPSANTSNTCSVVPSRSTSNCLYKTGQINFLGRNVNIIYQDLNGPCSLIAICNALLLKGVIHLEQSATEVQEEHLINCLKQYLEQSKQVGLPYSEMPSQARDALHILSVPLEMDVTFNRTDGFLELPQNILFRYLDISIYHAWLPDANDARVATLSSYSYPQLSVLTSESTFPNVEEAREFLLGPQFTPYGLRCLRNDLKDNVPCVLFWRKHFSAIIKIKEDIYALATDSGYLGTPVVWEMLLEEGTQLVDCNLIPVDAGARARAHINHLDPPFMPGSQVSSEETSSKFQRATNIVTKVNFEEFHGPLETFARMPGRQFSEKKELHDSGTTLEVVDTTICGRMIALDVLMQIVHAHQAKASWNGQFDKTTILVNETRSTLRACIKAGQVELSMLSALNDYTSYIDQVLSLFEIEGLGYPAFFRALIHTLEEESSESMMSAIGLVNFHMKLELNLALKFTLVRAEYWGGIQRVRKNAPKSVRRTLRKVLKEEALVTGEKWMSVICESGRPRLKKVLRHRRKTDENRHQKNAVNDESVKNTEFGNYLPSFDSLTQYPRQMNEHFGAEDDDDDDGVDESAGSFAEIDLWYSHYLQDPLSQAHDLMLVSNQMTDALWERLHEVFGMFEKREDISKYGR